MCPNIATFCRQGAGRQIFFDEEKKLHGVYISSHWGFGCDWCHGPLMLVVPTMAILDHAFGPFPFFVDLVLVSVPFTWVNPMPGWRNVLCLRPASHLPCKLFAASNRTICCMQRPIFWRLFEHFLLFFVRSSGHHAAFPSQHLLMPVAWQSIPSSDFKFDLREGVGLDGELQSFQLIYATCPPFYVTFLSFQFRCQHFFSDFFHRVILFFCVLFSIHFFHLPHIAFLMHRLDR